MSHFAPIAALLATFALTSGAQAAEPTFRFASIDGGSYDTADWRGQPVLVVNTASLCGFTPQYDALQELSDTYAARGLVVLAVPSNDFNQELADGAAVKQFCDINFDLTLPMTEITHVTGPQAHDFYLWLNASHGFAPGWNFNKALIGPDGALVATWGAATKPTASAITHQIEALLP